LKTVYLAGLINPKAYRSLKWRLEAARRLEEHFRVLDPLRGKDLTGDPVFYKTEGQYATSVTAGPIVMRDYNDVVRGADLLLVSLDSYGSSRPFVGTLFEIAWAWHYGKPIVVFYESLLEPEICKHPFVSYTATEMYCSLDSALDCLLGYYS
jgi:hypothetical protein